MSSDPRSLLLAFIHPSVRHAPGVVFGAYCVIEEGVELGAHTRLRNYVELRGGTVVGERCYLDSGVKSSGDNRIGDRVTVRYDAILCRGLTVGDDTLIAPQVMTINLDHEGNEIGGATIGKRCHIGTNATIQAGVTIADDVVVGAKALVTRDLLEPGVYIGVPARRVR